MPPRTALTELLSIEHPVIQAPMAGAATPELAAAVSGAGGLGSLGSAVLSLDELVRQGRAVREATDRPFNVNFFCHQPPELDEPEAARARERFGALYRELGLGQPPEPSAPPFAFDEARLAALLEIRPAKRDECRPLVGEDCLSSRIATVSGQPAFRRSHFFLSERLRGPLAMRPALLDRPRNWPLP